jgi:hypothetical protein
VRKLYVLLFLQSAKASSTSSTWGLVYLPKLNMYIAPISITVGIDNNTAVVA